MVLIFGTRLLDGFNLITLLDATKFSGVQVMKSLLLLIVLTSLTFSQSVLVVDSAGAGDYTTITAAITAATAGDTIKVLKGTYTGQHSVSKNLNLVASDTTAIVNVTGNDFVVGADCLIQGFKIIGTFRVTSGTSRIQNNVFEDGYVWMDVTSGYFTNNISRSSDGSSTFGKNSSASTLIVSGNHFSRQLADAHTNEIVEIYNYVLFKNNTVITSDLNFSKGVEVHTSGILVNNNISNGSYAISVKKEGVKIVGNNINNTNTGIIVTSGVDSVEILGNIFDNVSGFGVNFNSAGASTPYSAWKINNNVFKSSGDILYNNSSNAFSYLSFKNNVIYDCDNIFRSSSTVFDLQTLNSTIENNIIYDSNGSALLNNFTGNMNYSIHNTLTISGTGNLTADPLLNDPSTNDFSLQGGSSSNNTGNPDVYSYDLDRTRNDMGIYGGSHNWNNYNGISGPRVFSLKLSSLRVIQGNSPTITAEGVSN